MGRLVAVPPRSPIGYNLPVWLSGSSLVAVPPRSPIGYNKDSDYARRDELRFLPDLPSATISGHASRTKASCGSSPISHRLQYPEIQQHEIEGCGSSPISHRLQSVRSGMYQPSVAVPPRSPIGYNRTSTVKRSPLLRFLPDLPSATIQPSGRPSDSLLRFLPDLPSATIASLSHTGPTCCGSSPISHRLQLAPMTASPRSVAVPPRSPIGYNQLTHRSM